MMKTSKMRNSKKNFTLTLILTVTSFSFGQSKDDLEIRRSEKLWTAYLDKGDTKSILSIWSEKYIVNNPNGKIVSSANIVSSMR